MSNIERPIRRRHSPQASRRDESLFLPTLLLLTLAVLLERERRGFSLNEKDTPRANVAHLRAAIQSVTNSCMRARRPSFFPRKISRSFSTTHS